MLQLVDNKVADIKNNPKLTTALVMLTLKKITTKTVEPAIEALEELKGKFTVTKFDEKIGSASITTQ